MKNNDENPGINRWKAYEKQVMRIQGAKLNVFEMWVMKIHEPTGLGHLRNKYIQGPETQATGEFQKLYMKELHNL
jgi:hypothetical protein